MKLLLVEEDTEINKMVKRYLKKGKYKVTCAEDGDTACSEFDRDVYDLVLLDLMIPKRSGIEVMLYIRRKSTVPIILLTEKDSDLESVLELGLEAEDYIKKPFSGAEVLARIEANIPKDMQCVPLNTEEEELLILGDLVMNLLDCTVRKGDEKLEVTAKEFEILRLLFRNPKKVFTKAQIYSQVWNDAYLDDENAINVHISRLRNKIEDDPKNPRYIVTVWGIGYKLGDI